MIMSKYAGSCDWLISTNNSFNRPNLLRKIVITMKLAGFEVLTAVTMKNTVFCVVTPRNSEIVRRFRGRASQARNQQKLREKLNSLRTRQRYNLQDYSFHVISNFNFIDNIMTLAEM
jgi:cytidylate kinase